MIWDKLREVRQLFRGRRIEYSLRPYQKVLRHIEAGEAHLQGQTDGYLKELACELMGRVRQGTPKEGLLVEAFSLAREVAARVLGLRPYDVQMLASLAMYRGKLAEMETGEGKTLAAVLPAYLHALTGQGVHILTFNDYLARRDALWMGPFYEFLGVSVGYIQEGMSRQDRQSAYAQDVTYATAREVGFDYLRDQLCQNPAHLVQRGFHCAIVDEADSLLIDEARIPLVIASDRSTGILDLYEAGRIVRSLRQNQHYDLDEGQRNVYFTDDGLDALEEKLHCGLLHDHKNLELLTGLSLALQAEVLFKRDRDYIVRDGKIQLVDAFTGRAALDRQWPYGLQAAVEAKEGLAVQPEGMIRNSITLIHFMKYYQTLAAMTATAQAAADELFEFYDLHTVVVPPHRPCQRVDHPDVLFKDNASKEEAVIHEVSEVHTSGRPILVGTCSVTESERLASRLQDHGVACSVLNAKNDEEEARIIAQAGVWGAVTISTNMAGRGTDIKLGAGDVNNDHNIHALGGLYVIGTNRHESRRIDDQLRGRTGRQGDPGSSRFFVSLEDDLMQRYGLIDFLPHWVRHHVSAQPIPGRLLHREIERAQRIIEDQNFQTRHTLWRYAKMVEDQRQIFSCRREELLLGKVKMSLFKERLPERYQAMCTFAGPGRTEQVESQVTLYHMDKNWADYVSQIDLLRKFVHLSSLDGCCPLSEFHRTIVHIFADMRDRTEKDICNTLQDLEVSGADDDLSSIVPEAPAATWTYVINDNPLGDHCQRLRKRVRDFIRERLAGIRESSA